ncbi:MAG: Re/Si-specific NAD(P)(+) transhydrogenase subunit alpha [Micavibrio aeruginosavorus]|uniref:NAD(P) transhydrogenase subunit alpha part 1 n=1 Tax=Micavibrio aeruginosavorus TaxID=349221 RepID=A0A2W5N5M3_9BACT|nr:MAG: Re/Si-specific NAD(P)(+) transhydrogenase subunit alpha [Micavibrio aeruginosavorus]
MAITIAVAKETTDYEKRVAATPETVKKLIALGATLVVEKGAGEASSYLDKAYEDAGAKIVDGRAAATASADIILKVQVEASDLADLKKGALLVGLFAPYQNGDLISAAAAKGVDAFSMELVPRITRAQAMDVLSSQSNLAGYKAVLDAAAEFSRAFPMMMTAAGTIAPARVFVMGAGVAGLQAIATAKRLGAVVSANDVRPAAKEQVESLGGTFIAVQDEEFKAAETAGGYAKEMSAEYKEKQAKLVEETIAKQDIVITTALIPGRPAPKLVTAKMVESMKPGSVIVDLAVESGGNCELSIAGEVVVKHGVKIVGHRNVPSRLATDASALYARNILNLLGLVIDKESASLKINWEDDVIKGLALTKDGAVIHPNFANKS